MSDYTSVQPLERQYGGQAVALLHDLNVSLLGVRSPRLHAALVNDAVKGRVDCRIARVAGEVKGLVLAAPAAYWRSLPLTHWGIALESLRAATRRKTHPAPGRPTVSSTPLPFKADTPKRTWHHPGDAWRIIFIGTAAEARGKGIAAQLYRSLMADRSLVARVALENTASIRLHDSLGWRLYPDGDVALAVHERDADISRAAP